MAITFVVLNAGEVLLTAWPVARRFSGVFKLEDVPHVLGFLLASAIAASIGAAGVAIAVSFAEPTVVALQVRRIWLSAGLVGTVTVAPLLIGLGEAVRDVPPNRELVEGAIALVTLAALSPKLISLPQGPWATALPVAFVYPLLLCFSERRRSEAALKHSKERLQLALEGAELGAFSADLTTGRFEWDARAAQIHGHDALTMTTRDSRRFVHPNDRVQRFDAALAEAKGSGGRWNAKYRVLPPPGHPHAGETRWIAVDSSIMRDRQGIRAEQAIADLYMQQALAGRAGLVGTYAYGTDYNADVAKMQISPGYATVHGFPEGTTEITRNAWLARVHPEDVERLQVLRNQALHHRRCTP